MVRSQPAQLRAHLDANGSAIGFNAALGCAETLELAGPDWGWFWIDAQHGLFDESRLRLAARICDHLKVPGLVRVPGHDYATLGTVLDLGFAGVIVPMVDDPDQAAAIAKATRYAPHGNRSFGFARIAANRGPQTQFEDTPVVLVQIESTRGLDCRNEICATDGIDGLFFGPVDYGLSAGLHFAEIQGSKDVGEALDAVVATCQKHGKWSATVGGTPEKARSLTQRGVNLCVGARDIGILRTGISKARGELFK
jgi:4-hydroxy-2-oxoheptanedioate aldolase